MRILLATDKLKGALSAVEAAEALVKGFTSVWKDAEIISMPVADGGEGTVQVLHKALDAEWVELKARDPLGREVETRYCRVRQGEHDGLVIIAMNEPSGMWRLKKDERDPLRGTTFGTGELIKAASADGAGRIIVGLGGSVTNDGGTGMAAALGYRFLDKDGKELKTLPADLQSLDRIEAPDDLDLPEVIAAVDVRNPLLGENGATNVYGPQKGAGEKQRRQLEKCLARLADVVERDLGVNARDEPGAGAAGGLGFGLMAFAHAKIQPGFDIIARLMKLEDAIADADIIVAAEGSMDAQTLEGKAPAGVAELARKHNKPVIAFAGRVADEAKLEEAFDACSPLPDSPMDLDEALEKSAKLLERAAARAARLIQLGMRLTAAAGGHRR